MPSYNFDQGNESQFDSVDPAPRSGRHRVRRNSSPTRNTGGITRKLLGNWGRKLSWRTGNAAAGEDDVDDLTDDVYPWLQHGRTVWNLPWRILNPSKETVAGWMETWWNRFLILVALPALVVGRAF